MLKIALVCLLVIGAGIALAAATGFTVGVSFRGPGYDPEHGVTAKGAGETAVVAITYGRVASGERSTFRAQLRSVLDDMSDQSGLIGYAVRKELFGDDVWTMSAWVDEAALRDFLGADAHQAAVASGTVAAGSFRYAQVEIPTGDLPLDWNRALEILAAEGAER